MQISTTSRPGKQAASHEKCEKTPPFSRKPPRSHDNHSSTTPIHQVQHPTPQSHLLATLAIAGLDQSALGPADHAAFFEQLSRILPASASEAARYAATCIRESQRAKDDILCRLLAGKGAP